jgi:predicted SPOUT superfamily RNA methylase MTH1
METPQYLRKHLFSIRPTLRYVGILPPLRTPHHPLDSRIKNLTLGEYRDGVVVESSNRGSLIDIGVEKNAYSKKKFLPIGKRVTLKIVDLSQKTPYVSPIDSKVIDTYWGYSVSVSKLTLKNLLKKYDLKIATSKYGEFYTKSYHKLKDCWKKAENVLIVFGSSEKGLHKIMKNEGVELQSITNFIINTVPNQGTETIRTEEALWATLAVLNEI